ncbi:Superoxide dismutase [Mn], mitochondrial [Rhodotorula toruloides]|uniref:Superoxide dismutase n=1 Tax=Rhodotorula toruloides TaxID=5286 RepID=A0A061B5E5_RHOTO|nr:RHTO0S10e05930g1_1 [Rhodotorula toruloides]
MLCKLLISLAALACALAAPLALRSGTCAGLACGGPFLNFSLPASLPPLPYAYNALEPFVIEDIMRLHHDAVSNMSTAIKCGNVEEVVRLTESLALNGGGPLAQSLFWRSLAPAASSKYNGTGSLFPTSGPLHDHVSTSFDSVEQLSAIMVTAGSGIRGSGWVWTVWDRQSRSLEVITTANQNLPFAWQVPILGIDCFEHAYLVQYKTNRLEYLKQVFAVINWEEAEARLVAELEGRPWW